MRAVGGVYKHVSMYEREGMLTFWTILFCLSVVCRGEPRSEKQSFPGDGVGEQSQIRRGSDTSSTIQ